MDRTGLILAGGGARGAYEVGVLYYLFVAASRELRELAKFTVLSGTSVGAINIAAVAASLNAPAEGVRRLADIWRDLELDALLPLRVRDLVSIPSWLLGSEDRDSLISGDAVTDLIETSANWGEIDRRFEEGHLEALSISATHVRSGKTVVFFQTRTDEQRAWSSDPNVHPRPTRIRAAHARASAAIPFIFPRVYIDGQPYVDGGLRQNTPLSPALRLGAKRILVVDLRHERESNDDPWNDRHLERVVHRPIFLLGKVLNALMLDHVDYDIIRLQTVNRILMDGEQAFGGQFVERLRQVIEPLRGASYRMVPHIVVRPSRDLGMLAAQHVRQRKFRGAGTMAGRMVRMLARGEPADEADLTSYLLFDGSFADKLFHVGIEDAASRREDLLRFFQHRDALERE